MKQIRETLSLALHFKKKKALQCCEASQVCLSLIEFPALKIGLRFCLTEHRSGTFQDSGIYRTASQV